MCLSPEFMIQGRLEKCPVYKRTYESYCEFNGNCCTQKLKKIIGELE
jgi:hypothetical protein